MQLSVQSTLLTSGCHSEIFAQETCILKPVLLFTALLLLANCLIKSAGLLVLQMQGVFPKKYVWL